MNTLKMLLVFAVLGGVGYGVYHRLNAPLAALPPGVPETWSTAPTVQMPSEASAGMGPGGLLAGGGGPAVPGSPRPGSAPGMESAAPFDPANPPPVGTPPAPAYGAPPQFAAGQQGTPDAGPAGMAPPTSNGPAFDPNAANNPAGYPPPGAPPTGDPNQPPSPRSALSAELARAMPDNLRAAGNDLRAAANDLGAAANGVGAAANGVKQVAEQASASTFAAMIEMARRDLGEGKLTDVHRQLSMWYDDPRLAPTDQQRLTELLDQLAGTLIYSTQNLLDNPYEVQAGERLEDIAQRNNVPWQLLAKVNGIEDPQTLQPGEKLKIVKGPFSAVVSLDKRQLTLMLGEMYAGRFPIGLGREHPAVEGTYVVTEKVLKPTYHGSDRAIEADDPNNPLGQRWIGLGNQLGIHGTNDPKNVGRTDLPGCISLSPRDADDVYDILSVGSKVVIRR